MSTFHEWQRRLVERFFGSLKHEGLRNLTYLHVDIKYNDPQKRYLLVAIDRATRWVYLDKSAKTTAAFIRRLHEHCSVNIKIILTDNGKEFTDRFTAKGEREPTGNHAFDQAIEHRLIGGAGERHVF